MQLVLKKKKQARNPTRKYFKGFRLLRHFSLFVKEKVRQTSTLYLLYRHNLKVLIAHRYIYQSFEFVTLNYNL